MQSIKDLIQQKKVIIVGSGSACDWIINDFLIDEKHCQISSIGEDKYLIADLGTKHGTFVNNEKISHKEINENDFISIGAKIFQLKSAYNDARVAQEKSADADNTSNTKNTESREEPATPKEEKFSQPKTLQIYCLYAQEDEQAAIFLDKHLAALKHNQKIPIEVIGNFNRKGGDDRSKDNEYLKNANIILVFISADLISNESSYAKTMMAIDNHNKGKSLLLPILTRRCMWKDTPFSLLPLLPKNLEPLYSKKSWESEDDSFSNVVTEIKNSIDTYYKKEQEYSEGKTNTKPSADYVPLKTDFRAGYYWGIFWKRTFAYMLDNLILGIPFYILMYIIYQDEYQYLVQDTDFVVGQTFVWFTFATLIFSYFESSKNMASPGKKILGLIISNEHSEQLTFQKAIVRNLIKYGILFLTMIPLLSILYIIGQIAFYAAKHQFFQDILSKTMISPKVKNA